MKIVVAGSSGLIGSELISFLQMEGHSISRLIRDRQRLVSREFGFWDPDKQVLNPLELEGYDAVINLAGENVSNGLWTKAKKARLLSSRVNATRLLASTLAAMKQPPPVWINASAVGYYGNRGDDSLDEQSGPGQGFLADVCRQWEKAAEPALDKNIRTVFLRTGVVLSDKGGALQKMLIPFKLGLGGCIGSGQQYMSWISLTDLVGAIQFALKTPQLKGPVNAVSPIPVTNREFTKILGSLLNRPTYFTVPTFAARLAFGEMADELLLASAKVYPAALLNAGYTFKYPTLTEALKEIL